MANLIGIMGEPGSGKSTSLRNLNPEETYYCDCDGKGLNWKGWRDQYSTDKSNYVKTSFPQTIVKYLLNIAEKALIRQTIRGAGFVALMDMTEKTEQTASLEKTVKTERHSTRTLPMPTVRMAKQTFRYLTETVNISACTWTSWKPTAQTRRSIRGH